MDWSKRAKALKQMMKDFGESGEEALDYETQDEYIDALGQWAADRKAKGIYGGYLLTPNDICLIRNDAWKYCDAPFEIWKDGAEELERRSGACLLPVEFLPEVMKDIAERSVIRKLAHREALKSSAMPMRQKLDCETLGPLDVLRIRCWHMITRVAYSLWRKRGGSQ